ncbi:MAG TPA: hypothetical protein VKU36_01985 [Candidatus Babeliales bacterium]|nr:hypothetical protein [Candidatus Babeliales bacterium]
MKKIITITSLLGIFYASGMETKNTLTPIKTEWDIFGYLNWHRVDDTTNRCEAVEEIVNANPTIVNKKEMSIFSPFFDQTPLETAMIGAKCQRCEKFLRKNGAEDTETTLCWKRLNPTQEDIQYKT